MLKLTEDPNACTDMVHVTVRASAMGQPITASTSAYLRYAAIDGLLWWVLQIKLDALRNEAAQLPIHADMELAKALSTADGLLMYAHTVRYHSADGDDLQRIVRTLHAYLPLVQPLQRLGGAFPAELDEVKRLVAIITERASNEGICMRGVAVYYTQLPKRWAA